MFYGTTPQVVSQFLRDEISRIKPKRVWVLFAGNFVVEQIASGLCEEIHSTDISLYSKAIGHGIMDQDFGLLFAGPKDLDYIKNLESPLEKAAGVIFMTEVATYLNKTKIAYYRGLVQDAYSNTDNYIQKILGKLNNVKQRLNGFTFYGIDACKLVPEIKKGDYVFYDPPVLLGDYEKMFKPLEECYSYQEEEYTEMTEEVKKDHLEYFNSVGAKCFYRTNNPIQAPEGYEEVFRFQYKYNGNYCIYTNSPKKKFVGTFSPLQEEVRKYKIIGEDDEITLKSKVKVIPVKGAIANHYRMLWVKKATMSDAGYSFLIQVDEKIIGLVTVHNAMAYGTDLIPIFSDPACPYSKYQRLSRLILHIVCTRSFLDMFNEKTMWEHEGFTTRVLSNAPVSMKYRGLFELSERVEDPKGENFKYKLIYQNRKNIFKNYKTALQQWVQKYARYS